MTRIPMRSLVLTSAAVFLWAASGDLASAQTTASGIFGSRTVGGAGGLTAGSRNFTSGGGTLGQNQQFGGGQAVLNSTLQSETSGGVTGGARFLRENRSGQFVGSDNADIGAALQMLGGQGGAAPGQLGGQFGRNTPGSGNNRSQQPNQTNQSNGRNTPTYRISRSVGFRYQPSAAIAPSGLGDRLTGLLQGSTRIQRASPLEVQMRDRTAILRGSVSTSYDRDLAARLVLLQPGVTSVENRLIVSSGEPERLPIGE